MSCTFAELFCQTHYTFLKSASSPAEMVEQADMLGYQALAITDECSFAGLVKAWQRAKTTQLNFISGSWFASSSGAWVVLIQNKEGYQQLSALISHCRQHAQKGDYQFQLDDLLNHPLQDCLLLWQPKPDIATDNSFIRTVAEHFQGRFYLLVSRALCSQDAQVLRYVRRWSTALQVPVAASNAALMHDASRLPLLHTLDAIRVRRTICEHTAEHEVNAERRLRTHEELAQLFPSEWLEQTTLIASRCQFDLGSLQYQYPAEVVPAGYEPGPYLIQQAWAGANQRFAGKVPPAVAAQLVNELSLVHEKGYEHFFLTIYDLICFARDQCILFQGRGSAANSVLCYCLGITAVNPTQSQLLFERFISKERDEPPDIDVDFEHQRREEVIQYVYRKYGRHRAALTATVITYRLRSALRDVGKALGFPQVQLSQLLNRLDRRDSEEDWQAQLEAMGVLKHPMGQHLLHLTAQIRGFPRHLSQHVGGFVIAAEKLSDLVPVENASMPERTVIQWDKTDIEALKLLKVDVLGLGMLSALRRGLEWVESCYKKSFSLADIPQEDPAVYKMLQKADAIGVFQVESRAQMNMLPRLKPKTFYDLVVQVAIVRPGPIQGDMVHPYLRRRDGLEPVTYPSETVKSVLQRTLGVPIFQEQVIKLAMVAAGFSGGEADELRRAMGTWKSKGQMLEFRRKILAGMLQRGYEENFAVRLVEQILGFGEYGFPESHAASFANLAYASAWLKCHYPSPFYVGLLNSLPMGFYSAAQLIQDARAHGITVLPVCINKSEWDHQVVSVGGNWGIRLGFRIVKGSNEQAINIILKNRPAAGYTRIDELQALPISGVELRALASASALSAIAGHRYQTRWELTHLTDQPDLLTSISHQQNELQLKAPHEVENMTEDYASVGLTLGPHPLQILSQQNKLPLYKRANQLKQLRDGQLVTVMGLVVGRQRPATSTGVTFVTLEDETGNVNVVVWKDTGRKQRKQWLYAKLLEVKGKVEIQGINIHVVAGRMTDRSALLPTRAIKSRDFH